jgi:hypothetical protein
VIGAAVQLVAGFLAHATFGINPIAATFPHHAFTAPGDPTVDTDAPPAVAIYNDARCATLNLEGGYAPPEFPAVIVLRETRELEGSAKLDRSRAPAPRQIGIVIAYVSDTSADAIAAQAACETILRAAELSLRRYESQGNSDGYRELNGIRVMEVTRWKRVEESAALDRVKFWGWLEVELKVVDTIA